MDYTMLPTTAASDIIGGFMSVVGDNIAPILALLGITLGVNFVIRRLGSAKKGRA